MIILISISVYYAFATILISNDSNYNNRTKRILCYVNNKIETVADCIGNSIQVKSLKRRHYKAWTKRSSPGVVICSALAMQANAVQKERSIRFDTDSVPIGIDNRCSACISHVAEDFIGQLEDSPKVIKGFGGTKTTNVKVGTLSWTWNDDSGTPHKFIIPNSYYVPKGRVRLLSPQHWAKEQGKGIKEKNKAVGTLSQTTAKEVKLMWNERKNSLTVPLSPANNVATFHLAPGFNKYYSFCATAGIENDADDPIICEEITGSENKISKQLKPITAWKINPQEHYKFNNVQGEKHRMLDSKGDQNVLAQKSDEALLLHYHNKFGHLSFRKLKVMAKQGVIPSRLEHTMTPVCTACAYAKMTKRQWRSKQPKDKGKEDVPLTPGELVSVDQLVSPAPGLIAQMTGILTTKRYKYATVYVDQASRLGYIHLQRSSDAEETVRGKIAFEQYMQSLGRTVKGYQADNGIFRANKWQHACNMKG